MFGLNWDFKSIYSFLYSLLINGIFALNGSLIKASDLRGGASLVLASLLANGETIIENIEFVDRGYERFYEKLRNLGADIGVEEWKK